MRKPLFLLSGFLTALFFISAHAQEKEILPFRHYNVSDGLSNNIVYCILQDHLGLMWLGTEDGLNTFDGYQFYQFKCNPSDSTSLSNNIIRCIYEDKEHFIWVGTDDGLNVFNPATGKFKQFKNNDGKDSLLSSNFITAISEDSLGNIWVGTQDGLNIFNRKNQKFDLPIGISFSHAIYHAPINISSLLADNKAGIIWIGTNEGLVKMNSNKPGERSFPSAELNITCLFKDRDNNIWAGTLNDGFLKADPSSGQLVKGYKNSPSDPNSLSQNSVFSISEDSKGQLWIATLGGGLNIYNKGENRFHVYSANDRSEASLSSNLAWSVLVDKAGTAWIGTSAGLNTYDKNRVKFSTLKIDPEKGGNNNILSIYKDHENNLWLGVLGSGLYEYDLKANKIIASFKNIPGNPNSLSNNDVFSILEDKEGNLWVGTFNGLNKLDKSRKKNSVYKKCSSSDVDCSLHLSDNYITSLFEDRWGSIWVGTFSGGLNIMDKKNNTCRLFNPGEKEDYLAGKSVSCIFEDKEGKIWVGTFDAGLNMYDSRATTKINFRNFRNKPANDKSISSNYIYCLNEDNNGILWIGTYGGGLNSIKNKKTGEFSHDNDEEGISNSIIDGIIVDNNNHLWLSTNNGIIEFVPGNGKVESHSRSFDERDGLQYKYNPGSCFKSNEGELCFGGVNGFNVFNPKQIVNNPNQPPVIITRFKVFDKDFPLDTAISQKKKIVLSSAQKFFSFEFAGLNYAFPEKNKYAYKLEGFDKDWIESGSRRYAAYTNLDQGTYTFRVKAANNDGVWNDEGASVTVVIRPPFWKTWWFYLIDALICTLTIVTFIRVRTRSLLQQNKEMERKVSLRTQELQTEKEKTEEKSAELEKTLRHLETTQDQLIQSEKLASLGALTAGIAHEIQNPLNFVNNYSEVSKELIEEAGEESSEEKRKEILKDLTGNLEKIYQHGRRADRIVKAMLMHSRAEAGEKELTDINALCEEAINLSLPGVRANIPDFRCEMEKHYAPGNPMIKITKQDISRVILNLLNNAFYAVDEKNKKLSQQTKTTGYSAKVILTTSVDKGYVVISIHDNGEGIPASIKEKIFQPFFTTKPSGVGTGLGLSISYDIIKSHGGEIKLNSKEGEFTEFIISLPI